MSEVIERAAAAARAIVFDNLGDRRGIKNELEACGPDIRQEIVDSIASDILTQFADDVDALRQAAREVIPCVDDVYRPAKDRLWEALDRFDHVDPIRGGGDDGCR